MSFVKLLTQDRKELVYKIYNEMEGIALSAFPTISDGENNKSYFLQLVNENQKLLENEKEYFRERFIYNFELNNAKDESGKPKECNKCKLTKYSDRFCEGCISLQLQDLFTTWTSGNNIIDDFIQQCQMASHHHCQNIF